MSATLLEVIVDSTELLEVRMALTDLLEVILTDSVESTIPEESSGAGYILDELGQPITDETGGGIADQ